MLHRLISTYLFVGYLPKAPGTWGSLLSIPLIWFLYKLGFPYYLGFYLILFPLAVWASYKTALELNNPDPDEVVIDEVLGMMTVYFFVPPTPLNMVLGFILFRLIDITKPFPIKVFEKIPYGVGIIVDDILAGVYTGLILWLLNQFLTK